MSVENRIKAALKSPPLSFDRVGKDLFVPVPVYRAKKQYKVSYVNRDLFNRLFKSKKQLSFKEMAGLLEEYFNFTIEPEKGTGYPIGMAYADRQKDPLDLSLSGNLGSGRAYYFGKWFNIKGEKTPLAISSKRRFSDGLLEMERCIWETLVANGLQGSFKNGMNEVLAILDMDETCSVLWRDAPVRRGKIIRVDLDGALDRITHLFYNRKPLGRKALLDCAARFGEQEADKFIERIVHGTWSPGNISPKGHLIDFDTVGATKGRSPQYSSTQWYHQNYFGYEYLGQSLIIEALAKDRKINKDRVKADVLRQKLLDTRISRIRQRFIFLMGFKNDAEIYKKFKAEIDPLCDLWMSLSRKSYQNEEALSLKKADCVTLPVFDFSRFMRFYPMQKRAGIFSVAEGMRYLQRSEPEGAFSRKKGKKLTLMEQPYRDAVFAVIGDDFVKARSEVGMLNMAAVQFIKKYDSLFEKILRKGKGDLKEAEAQAYIVNEDRNYMYPAFTLSFDFAEKKRMARQNMHNVLEALILSAQRMPAFMRADVKLMKNGYTFSRLNGKGEFRKEVCSYRTNNIKRDKYHFLCKSIS